ncbi:hypothetical protein [Natronoglycomyces albus]|uniref:Uncharacterized protein n=1 Tax=Natronoglycomyces albus TaxID=2811108 RepID=A0A895XL39_9ACTN|nr:hypothetical protein [Natronoglycomyces albus]QSB06044.1 hypothetical protein JQS30_03725 [Natronoglycomyces albus]
MTSKDTYLLLFGRLVADGSLSESDRSFLAAAVSGAEAFKKYCGTGTEPEVSERVYELTLLVSELFLSRAITGTQFEWLYLDIRRDLFWNLPYNAAIELYESILSDVDVYYSGDDGLQEGEIGFEEMCDVVRSLVFQVKVRMSMPKPSIGDLSLEGAAMLAGSCSDAAGHR